MTTSAGFVTLLTGLVTFAASRSEQEAGLNAGSVTLAGIALAGFVVAGVVALLANRPRDIKRPKSAELLAITKPERWDDGESESENECVVAAVMVEYLTTLRTAGDATAKQLAQAIGCQGLRPRLRVSVSRRDDEPDIDSGRNLNPVGTH